MILPLLERGNACIWQWIYLKCIWGCCIFIFYFLFLHMHQRDHVFRTGSLVTMLAY